MKRPDALLRQYLGSPGLSNVTTLHAHSPQVSQCLIGLASPSSPFIFQVASHSPSVLSCIFQATVTASVLQNLHESPPAGPASADSLYSRTTSGVADIVGHAALRRKMENSLLNLLANLDCCGSG